VNIEDMLTRAMEAEKRALTQEREDCDPAIQCLPEHHRWQSDTRSPSVFSACRHDLIPDLRERQRCARCGMTQLVERPPIDYAARNFFPTRKKESA
jgi:hypothetical protein